MSKDDDDFNWDDDDIFGGDMDFDSDFDMDPFKNQSFLSAAATGFLNGVVDGSVGSTDAVIKNARTYLPDSFSTGLDKLQYLKDKGVELVREFQEGNVESVKSLQSIAKTISGKIKNEDSYLKGKLDDFTEKDFSSWEKPSNSESGDNLGSVGEVSDDDVNNQLAKLMGNQSSLLSSLGDGINQMAAAVGGRSISATMAGNRELIGIQSNLRDILDYHRKVQAKMDGMKIELLARTFMLNAKFYKFMEAGMHAEVKELKKIAIESAKSEYEKTTHFQASKEKVRDVVLTRAGGLLASIRENFGKEGREEKYNAIESALSQISSMLEMGSDITPSWGMAGNMAGGMASQYFLSELPRFINQGPFKKFGERAFQNNPEWKEKYDRFSSKLRDTGNKFSYNMNALPGMMEYYSQYWEDLDEYKYMDYEDYVEQMNAQGKKPMPRAAFAVYNPMSNQVKGFINSIKPRDSARGMQYALRQKNAAELSKAGIWKEINNVTLVDIIPGLLRLQLESLEKIRTGNDAYIAPSYSFNRGQFVSHSNAKKVVESDVFNHSSMESTALNANKITKELDKDNTLTKEERDKFTLKLVQNADKYGFNPYYYTEGIGDEDDVLNQRISKMIRDRFNISDDHIKKYEDADAVGKLKMASLGFTGDDGETLNRMGSMVDSLKRSIPNLEEVISASRSAGNDQILRELGVIKTKDGRDVYDMDQFWNRLMKYIEDPNNKELKGSIDDLGVLNAGDTLNGMTSRRDSSNINKKARKISDKADDMQNTAQSTTRILNETMEKLAKQLDGYGKAMSQVDFSKISVDLGTIPTTLETIRDFVEKMHGYNTKQESLLEQIAGCVCRSAGGWGKLTDREKENVVREENEGKKTLMDRLKAINPKAMIDKGIETLVNNQPLILGGILGGLGVLATHDPKAALLISGGMVAAKIYSKLGDVARGREPSNEEDILDENGEPVLQADRLRQGYYYDLVEKRVIKEWKEIKGALYDIGEKTYITLKTLTGKLFGSDGRAIIISGLSKVKDALVKIWNKVDIFGQMSKGLDKGKELFYQQDIYVKGEKEPKLTRGGFQNGRYYCYDTGTKEPYVITGWNKIKGPVYEIGEDNNLTQIVTEADLAKGLVTSAGLSIDKLGSLAKLTGLKVFDFLGKTKDYTLEKAGLIKEKAKEVFANDYTGIESRIDRIYYLLCEQFGKTPVDLQVNNGGGLDIPPPPVSDISDDLTDLDTSEQERKAKEEAGDPLKVKTSFPDKIRLGSLADKEIKEEEAKKDEFYDNVRGIREHMDEQAGNNDEDGKKKKGILGTIAGLLAGSGKFLKNLVTNPIGTIVGGLFSTVMKAPGRIIKMGSLLFSGVMGVASPIYKILSWGFGGMMWGLKRLLFSNSQTFGDWFSGRRSGRGGRGNGGGRGNRRFRLGGKFGKIAGLALGGYAAYEGIKGITGMMGVGDSTRDILNKSQNEYDRFYGDESYQGEADTAGDNDSAGNMKQVQLGQGLSTAEAIPTAALAAAQAAGTAKTLGIGSLSEAGGALGEHTLGKLVGARAGKIGAKAIPLIGQAMMAMDAYEGFTNKEEIGEIFNTNVINGRQRLSNGIGNVLDMGGAISGVMNWAADKTGIEALRQEGGMTRAIDSVLDIASSGPLKYLTPMGWLSMWETETSQPQNKIRLALYGVANGSSELGRAIGAMEYQLDKYVKFDNNKAWLDDKAPIKEVLNSFATGNPEELVKWFVYRFKPIYLMYQSAIRTIGYHSIPEFDNSKSPNVLSVIERVRTSLVGLSPYPLDIVANIDKSIPIMARIQTEATVTELMNDLSKNYKDMGIKEDGSSSLTTTLKTGKEVSEGTKGKNQTGLFDSIGNWSRKFDDRISRLGMTEEVKVTTIDISDLHKDQDTPMDLLTFVRLFAYGNTENTPWRVDAVLKLERYCESVTTFSGGEVRFMGRPEEIYNLFKNSFRANDRFAKEWVEWFNQRFLPVFKQWFLSVYKLRRNKPGRVWQSMSDTNKYQAAIELTQVMVVIKNDSKSVWDIDASPFPGSYSGDDSSIAKSYLASLEAKSASAKLKEPFLEVENSKARDMSESMDSAGGDKKNLFSKSSSGGYKDYSGSSNVGKLYEPNVPLYTPTGNTPNNYTMTASGALGGANTAGTTQLAQIEGAAGTYGGTGTNFTPESLGTKDGFKISEKDAIKTILNEFVKQGITDNRVLAFALANAKAETGFQGSAESLNYSSDRLPGIFKSTFGKNPELAMRYGRNGGKPADQKSIANIAYGNKFGNKGGDDGWMYRGRGFTQLTFKGNYDQVGKAIGENISEHPEKLTTDPVVAAKSAAGFFKIHPELMAYAKNGQIGAAAKVVGLHQEGIEKKVAAYPDFLKRLTQGDLKDVLNSEETKDGNTPAEGEAPPPEAAAPVVQTPAADNATIANMADADTQKAAGKVNAAPQSDSGTGGGMAAPSPIPMPESPERTPDVPTEPPAAPETTPTPPPVQTPVVEQKPVRSDSKATKDSGNSGNTQSSNPQGGVNNSNGVVSVSDEGVIRAIGALAEVFKSGFKSQTSLGGNRRVPVD